MATNVLLLHYNNYFNRIVKKESSVADYKTADANYSICNGVNFVPGDGIDTSLVLGFGNNPSNIFDNGMNYDYLVVMDSEAPAYTIQSRWFIVETHRTRDGQWELVLHRDVIADNLDNLQDAPIFVEKGMLANDDSFVLNDEGMNLNQIKTEETLIKDDSNSAWVVGYIAKNNGGGDINIQIDDEDIDVPHVTLEEIETDVGLANGTLSSLVNIDSATDTMGKVTDRIIFDTVVAATNVVNYTEFITTMSYDFSWISGSITGYYGYQPYLCNYYQGGWDLNTLSTLLYNAIQTNKTALNLQINNILGKSYMITTPQYNAIKTYQGKVVKYLGRYYRLNFTEAGNQTETATNVNSTAYTALEAVTVDFINSNVNLNPSLTERRYKSIQSTGKGFYLQLMYISSSDLIPQLNTTISSGRKITGDQEFDIIALPLSCNIINGNSTYQCIEYYTKRIASAISLDQNASLYDLQLLPYCPIQDIISSNGNLDISSLAEHGDYDYVTKNVSGTKTETIANSAITYTFAGDGSCNGGSASKQVTAPSGATIFVERVVLEGSYADHVTNTSYSVSGQTVSVTFTLSNMPISIVPNFEIKIYYHNTLETTKVGIMFYIQNSSFTLTTSTGYTPTETNLKVLSNCYMWRLISPNYQGAFEFNIAKNGGSIASYNIFCTYKPFTPLIKVAPEFNYLYGQEFQDNRGLICAGDFSLPRITDEFRSYELQNKNYQNIFNREIQHLDFMQGLEMRNQLVSGAAGILSDTAKGAGAGGLIGGGIGAIAGGIVGGATSAVGYGIDVDTLARTHRENKQLAVDKFNYQLGNIKALPYTLTKVGSFDAISKIFPVLETYKCSDKELEAFNKKIQYESMTVMRIGTLREFANFNNTKNYFKGSLIRNEAISDDAHMLNAIYEELLKGVYI